MTRSLLSALVLIAVTAPAMAESVNELSEQLQPSVQKPVILAARQMAILTDQQLGQITAGAANTFPGAGLSTTKYWNDGLQKAHDTAPGSAGYGTYTAGAHH
jgi:hypothetical protein